MNIYKDNPIIISNIELFDGTIAVVKDTEKYKALKSEDYNFFFNKSDGFFCRWGKGNGTRKEKITKQEAELYLIWCGIWQEKFDIKVFMSDLETDGKPEVGLPEIADIEISTSCHGVSVDGEKSTPCAFCYKSNRPTKNGEGNMSLETFKKVFEKITKFPTIGQIAFGITDIDANPDMWKIFEYTRSQSVIPNVTINGDRMTSEFFDKIANTMGATAISYYDKNLTYNAVKELTDRGMKQVNIHYMLSLERYGDAIQLIKDYKTDSRLEKLNAIVFLSLKPKNRGNTHVRLSDEKFKELVNFALDTNTPIGFDSCSQPKFIRSIKDRPDADRMEKYTESCESSIYSMYINSGEIDENGISDPMFYPCSFSEKIEKSPGNWNNGISILRTDEFLKDIWFSSKVRAFRDITVNNKKKCLACPIYDI
jgi:hypothetical protein